MSVFAAELFCNLAEAETAPQFKQSQSQSLFFETTPQDFLIKEGSQSHTGNKQNGQRTTKENRWLMQLGHSGEIGNAPNLTGKKTKIMLGMCSTHFYL